MDYFVNIHGAIMPDSYYWGEDDGEDMSCCTPKQVQKQIAGATVGDTIYLSIASEGGSVIAGHLIVRNLKATGATLVGDAKGFVASEATYILANCDKRMMAKNAMLMIHNAESCEWGTQYELESMAKVLQNYDNMQIALYAEITGKTEKYITENYVNGKNDVYLTAEDALSEGFINEIYNGIVPIPSNNMPQASGISDKVLASFQALKTTEERKKFISNRVTNLKNMTNKTAPPTTTLPSNENQSDIKSIQAGMIAMQEQVELYKKENENLVLSMETLVTEKTAKESEIAQIQANAIAEKATFKTEIDKLQNSLSVLSQNLQDEKIKTDMILEIACTTKKSGLPPTRDEVFNILNSFLSTHIVSNDTKKTVTEISTGKVLNASFSETVRNYAKVSRPDLYNVQTGNGIMSSQGASPAPQNANDNPKFLEIMNKALTKYHKDTKEYCQFIIAQDASFADLLDQRLLALYKLKK
jgi:ATP-dependent protease ClpP protease subunit